MRSRPMGFKNRRSSALNVPADVVTGAAGFIGSRLVGRLLAEGQSVVGIDSFDDYYGRTRQGEESMRRSAGTRSSGSWNRICSSSTHRPYGSRGAESSISLPSRASEAAGGLTSSVTCATMSSSRSICSRHQCACDRPDSSTRVPLRFMESSRPVRPRRPPLRIPYLLTV